MISYIYFSTGLALFTVTAIFTYNLLKWPRRIFKRLVLHLLSFCQSWTSETRPIASSPQQTELQQTDEREHAWSPSEILQQLGKTGVFPVAATNGWELCEFQHGLRVWRQKLTSGVQSRTVFGTCTVLKVHPETLLTILTDTALLGEWNPGILSVNMSQKTGHTDGSDAVNDSILGFSHDILLVKKRKNLDTVTEKWERYWNYSSDGVGWLLTSSNCTWKFYLLQPNSDRNHCFLNVVNFTDGGKENNVICQMVAMEIACLREYLSTQEMYITEKFQTNFTGMSERFIGKIADEDNKLHAKRKLFHNHKLTKEEKRFRTQSDVCFSASEKEPGIVKSTKSLSDLQTVHETSGDSDNSRHRISQNRTTRSKQVTDSPTTCESGVTPPIAIHDIVTPPSSTPIPPISCEYELISKDMLNGVGRDGISDREESPISGQPSSNESECSSNRSWQPSSPINFNPVEFITFANQTAGDLIAEVLNASDFAENSSLERQNSRSGEWLYHGFDNSVTMLKKSSRQGSTLLSYLGKGVIDTTPDQVWNIIRNPQARFMYDDTLKKLKVVNQLNEQVKIVHCHHEIQQLFRKESWDLCVLQSERIDGDRFILAMQSVDVVKKQGKRVTRATVHPSGWIVEPFERVKDMCSIVTYVTQMDFGASTSALEDIVAKQPLAIVQLRNYLQPSIELSTNKSKKS